MTAEISSVQTPSIDHPAPARAPGDPAMRDPSLRHSCMRGAAPANPKLSDLSR
jgi:hypothetical protein